MPLPGEGAGTSLGGTGTPFTSPWSSSGSGGGGSLASAPPSAPAPDTSQMGAASIDVTSPQGMFDSLKNGPAGGSKFFEALGSALFSDKQPSLLGHIPVVGNIGRALGDNPIASTIYSAPGAVGDAIVKATKTEASAQSALGYVVGPGVAAGVSAAQKFLLDNQFDAAPSSAEKDAVQAQIAADPSIAGYLKHQYLTDQAKKQPNLFPELSAPAGSLADQIGQAFGLMGAPERLVERGVAGLTKVAGGDRLDEITRIAEGKQIDGGLFGTGAFAGEKGLTAYEAIAYAQWKSGAWTPNQARDFLAANASGFSHNPALEIGGSVALDPTVWGSVGAAGLAKLGVTGARLAAAGEGVALREAGTASKLNVLGKVAESHPANDFLRWYGSHVYGPLEGSAVGRGAKIVRTIIDPLHAVGQERVPTEAMVDVISEASVRAVYDAYGTTAGPNVLRWAHGIDPNLYEKIAHDMDIFASNQGRLAELTGAQRAALNSLQRGEQLIGTLPGDAVSGQVAAHDFPSLVKQGVERVRPTIWDDAAKQNLATRLASVYGSRSIDDFKAEIAKLGDEELSFLHGATYGGGGTREFLDAVGKSAPTYAGRLPLERLVAGNANSLTDLGASGLLKTIAEGATPEQLAASGFKSEEAYLAKTIKDAQTKYPELRYVTIREGSQQAGSIDHFESWLKSRLEKGVFMSQVTADELAKFPQPLQDWAEKMHGAFNLAFRPENDLLWGLERDVQGLHYAAAVPWADHVGDGIVKYRPATAPLLNIAGMPILSKVAKAAVAPLDYIDAGMRTLKGGITAAEVTENAKSRLIRGLVTQHDLTEEEAKQLSQGVIEAAQLHKSTARALSSADMWDAVDHLVPPRLRDTNKFTKRDLLNAVMDAYEGDMRFVGLTQKLTGRAKAALASHGVEMIGQVAEGAYPTIKFKINALFQLQEKIEPIILNSWRGIISPLGTKMTEADRLMQSILDRYAETGVIRMSDVDQQEFYNGSLIGRDIEQGMAGVADASWWDQALNVKGTKRVAYLRTNQHQLGVIIKGAMDAHEPGLWNEIKAVAQAASPTLVSDDEVALRYLAEQTLGNEVHVDAIVKPGARAADFDHAISPEIWQPGNIGEQKVLNLNMMARVTSIPLADGRIVNNIKDMYAALAEKSLTWDRIEEALLNHNAHPDYINRVHRALDFHYDPFWRTVRDKYALSAKQTSRLESMMAGAARVRGMTPVEYLSQVFSPYIEKGSKAAVDDLGKSVSILKAGEGSTEQDLMYQLADVFHAHLDPSGREALLAAFEKAAPADINNLMAAGGKKAVAESQALQKTVEQLRGGWDGDATRKFANAVLDRMNGAPKNGIDVEVAVQQFAKWSKAAIADGLLTEGPNPYSGLLSKIAGLPTDAAAPFNKTHQLMMDQITHAMRLKENDAFRLHYFARERSFLQRSINHPMFGIYPASYMWGKIMPELLHFVAREPFGIRTGAAAYALTDVQKSMAIQREFDPKFDKLVNDLGHNQAVWFLGYLLPAVPWDIGAAAPVWMRDLAQQAADNQARVDKGQRPLDVNLGQTIGKVSDYVSPLRPIKQVNNALAGLGKAPFKPAKQTVVTAPSPTGPTSAVDIGQVLQQDFDNLKNVLFQR